MPITGVPGQEQSLVSFLGAASVRICRAEKKESKHETSRCAMDHRVFFLGRWEPHVTVFKKYVHAVVLIHAPMVLLLPSHGVENTF